MTVIFSNYIAGRKYETAILRANGLTMKEMIMILNVEALYEIRTVLLVGIITLFLLSFVLNILAQFSLVTLNLQMILLFLAISVFTILIPTLAAAVIVNRNKPSKVLRN
jgi:ABC-type antimicrobial peptide transport system permease subunit